MNETKKALRLTKEQLLETIRIRLETSIKLTKKDTNEIFGVIFETIQREVTLGNEVNIQKFGVFFLQGISARTGRNPTTGEKIEIPYRTKVHFRASKAGK